MTSFNEGLSGFGSDVWERRPDFLDPDEEGTSEGVPNRVVEAQSASPFDYLHFVHFIAVRGIHIINYEDLELENGDCDKVGTGAAMEVSLASWKGEVVALKTARSGVAESKPQEEQRRPSERWLHDLFFELQIMSHRPLCEHPNIVQLKGISFADDPNDEFCPILVVEPACREYPDLTRFILSQEGKIGADLAAELIADIADGISVLHVYGVIHGDVKPENILIFPAGGSFQRLAAKICDFGFSGSRFSEDAPRGNTPAWTAPECFPTAPIAFHRHRNEPKQDIYSFGLVAAFILLGRAPVPIEATSASATLVGDVQKHYLNHPWIENFLPLMSQCLAYDALQRLSSLSRVRRPICSSFYIRLLTYKNSPDSNEQTSGIWNIVLNPFRRDLAEKARESNMIDFSLQNASFVQEVYPNLPQFLQRKLVDQVRDSFVPNEDPPQRMLAAYRTLRQVRPDLPPIEGTDPGIADAGNNDFSRLLHQSMQGGTEIMDALFSSRARLQDDVFAQRYGWQGISQAELRQFSWPSEDVVSSYSESDVERLVSFRSKRGFGFLNAACRVGRVDVLRMLLSHGVSPNDAPPNGFMPLHEAVAYSQHACAQLLLSHHADTESPVAMLGSSHQTALSLASSKPDPDMTSLLLKHGADPWHRILDNLQNTAAHVCAVGFTVASITCLRILLESEPRLALARNSHGRTPLHYAAGTGNIEGIKHLMQAGADPNAIDINGSSPLHSAWNGALDVVGICAEYMPEKLQDDTLKLQLTSIALISSQKHLKPLDALPLLIEKGADQNLKNRKGLDPKEYAFLNLLITLGIESDAFSSNNIAWSRAQFAPWYSSFILRTSTFRTLVLRSSSSGQTWFLEALPVFPKWGYYLTTHISKLDNSWNDSKIQFSVYAWKREARTQPKGDAVQYANADAARLLHFTTSVGSLIKEPGHMYGLNLGLVQIHELCDIMVHFEVAGNALGPGGGLVLGALRFLLEPDYEIRACHQTKPHPDVSKVQIFIDSEEYTEVITSCSIPSWWQTPIWKLRDGFPWNHLSLQCTHWHRDDSPDLRCFDLNGITLSPQRSSWLVLLLLCVFLHLVISRERGSWSWYVTIFLVYLIARRDRRQRRFEVFPRWRRLPRRSSSTRLHALLWLLVSQPQIFVLIYCFRHDLFSALALLVCHVLLCFLLRNSMANDRDYHVLGPLGLDPEVFLPIFITQGSRAAFGRG